MSKKGSTRKSFSPARRRIERAIECFQEFSRDPGKRRCTKQELALRLGLGRNYLSKIDEVPKPVYDAFTSADLSTISKDLDLCARGTRILGGITRMVSIEYHHYQKGPSDVDPYELGETALDLLKCGCWDASDDYLKWFYALIRAQRIDPEHPGYGLAILLITRLTQRLLHRGEIKDGGECARYLNKLVADYRGTDHWLQGLICEALRVVGHAMLKDPSQSYDAVYTQLQEAYKRHPNRLDTRSKVTPYDIELENALLRQIAMAEALAAIKLNDPRVLKSAVSHLEPTRLDFAQACDSAALLKEWFYDGLARVQCHLVGCIAFNADGHPAREEWRIVQERRSDLTSSQLLDPFDVQLLESKFGFTEPFLAAASAKRDLRLIRILAAVEANRSRGAVHPDRLGRLRSVVTPAERNDGPAVAGRLIRKDG